MKIFISWSGDRSKKVAELFDWWLKCVIQAGEPWISSKDIDRGALWFTEISDQLVDTCIGIICLTHENKNKPWILFESGALAKGLSSNRVCTFLIDLQPADLENPLAQFNATIPSKESVQQLVRTINRSLKDAALSEMVLEKVFDTYWPQFNTEFSDILKTTPHTEVKEKRKDNDIIADVLSTVRMLDKRLRNMEVRSETQHNYTEAEFASSMRNRTRGIEVRTFLNKRLKEGASVSTIIDEIVNMGFSHIYARNIVTEALANKNENDTL